MYMVDRQWRMMGSMQSTIASQADDLRALRTTVQSVERQIDEGVAVAATGQSSGDGGSDNAANAFRRAKQARQQEGFAEGDWYVDSFSASLKTCLLYTSPSPRDGLLSRMPSSA